ncbi:patatin-like phospholipase family protein [Candidatus Binatia bacterium]|nr:patatin-like phospholipase family protein [Candidatus Binatia bacterium]
MGITIVQKSDLTVRKRDPKIALVLAGGAMTGGSFKIGGLKALDDFLVNRKTTEFHCYVGLSAGALLAAPLASGITPAEMHKSLEGKSDQFTRFRVLDFYNPNFGEYLSRPLQFAVDAISFLPGTLGDLLKQVPGLTGRIQEPLAQAWRRPSMAALREVVAPIAEALDRRRSFPSPLDYLPSGIFDNSSIGHFLRQNFERTGYPIDFRDHYRLVKRELYIGAMNLDTAERVIFGHDEDTSATIPEAVQASTALPGFYKPARINGIDYVDGGVRRTANIDVAIEHGADLVICYNPFRPFSNRVRRVPTKNGGYRYEGVPMAERGVITVINQVFRTLLHSRLQYGLRQYQDDPTFYGDIVVIEPKETDLHFFQTNPINYWERIRAAQYGYLSVTESIEQNYDLIKQILESYGVSMTRKQVRVGVERIREASTEDAEDVLSREVPARSLSVA